jgi:hypothetical protein
MTTTTMKDMHAMNAKRKRMDAVSTKRRIRRHAVVAVGMLSLVAGCSDDGGTSPAKDEKTGSSTASAEQVVGARAALTGFACKADASGQWSASGQLNNADKSKATYVVIVSVAGKDSHVVAETTRKVTVDAGGSADLDAPDFGKADGKGLRCSAHVTRLLS